MDDLLTDQQQAEQVRGWLRQNGTFLVAGVALGLAGLFGLNQWNRFQEQKAVEASVFYETFMASVRSGNLPEVEAGMATLESDFGTSPYAAQGRLALAKLYLDQGKPEEAAAQLREVVDSGVATELRNIARLRLARVLIYQDKNDEALKVLAVPDTEAFAPAFHDVRGDVYFAMGKQAEARSEYEQALNTPEASGLIDRTYIEAKLDDLGGGTAAVPAAAAPTPAP